VYNRPFEEEQRENEVASSLSQANRHNYKQLCESESESESKLHTR
jgi:hypothetical protein